MLVLPTCHSEAELDLARRIEAELHSADLHVFWTEGTPAPAASRPPGDAVAALVSGLALLGAVVDALASALIPRRAPR